MKVQVAVAVLSPGAAVRYPPVVAGVHEPVSLKPEALVSSITTGAPIGAVLNPVTPSGPAGFTNWGLVVMLWSSSPSS